MPTTPTHVTTFVFLCLCWAPAALRRVTALSLYSDGQWPRGCSPITRTTTTADANTRVSVLDRRDALRALTTTTTATTTIISSALMVTTLISYPSNPVWARTPGSKDVAQAVRQIQDAAYALQHDLMDHWSRYSVIDAEGRAGSTDGARRILGGIAPQAGQAAIVAAQQTPLYRIDVAFVTVRKAVLEGEEGDANDAWTDKLDLDRFEELAEKIVYELQKADGNFYGVLFAAKGTKMIEDIFVETKMLVQQGIIDLNEMVGLLKDAGAPGLV